MEHLILPLSYLSPLLRLSRVPLHLPNQHSPLLYFPYTCRAFIKYDTVRSRARIKFAPRSTPLRAPLVTFAPPLFRSSLLLLPHPSNENSILRVFLLFAALRFLASPHPPSSSRAPATTPQRNDFSLIISRRPFLIATLLSLLSSRPPGLTLQSPEKIIRRGRGSFASSKAERPRLLLARLRPPRTFHSLSRFVRY